MRVSGKMSKGRFHRADFTYLRLQIDGEESVAHRGDNKTHKTEPYGGNPQHFEDRELLTGLGISGRHTFAGKA